MDEIIISQPWGGLGDNLQFSTLPELYSNLGYKVFISNNNAYRNKETYDLVWKLNPYISGISEKTPNAGSIKGIHIFCNNPVKNMEISHNLKSGDRKYLKLYYKPKYIEDLSNTLLYDITSISSSYSDSAITDTFTKIFDKYPELRKQKVEFKQIANRSTPNFNTSTYMINDIFHYCDAIYSCKVHLSVMSGSMCIASAIKEDNEYPHIYCVHTHKNAFPGCGLMFIFDNVNYILINS